MDIQTIAHGEIHPSPLNPRHSFKEGEIEELAASIEAAGGLHQNLVARPRKEGGVEIVAGERRWRACELLIDAGKMEQDQPLPVKVIELDDLALLRAALIENVQREDLTPLEEAEAFARLVKAGDQPKEIAASIGRSRRHVELRLQLVDKLGKPAKKALAEGKIGLAHARVLAASCPKGEQPEFVREAAGCTAGELRRRVTWNKAPVERAVFDVEASGLALIRGEDGTATHFVDTKAFLKAQWAAVEAKQAAEIALHRWCEIVLMGSAEDRAMYDVYERATSETPKSARRGLVICYGANTGMCRSHGNMVRVEDLPNRRASPGAAGAGGKKSPRERAIAKASPTQAGLDAAKVAKTDALRLALIDHGDAPAKVLVILGLMVRRYVPDLKIKLDSATWQIEVLVTDALRDVFASAKAYLGKLASYSDTGGLTCDDGSKLPALYRKLCDMPPAELDRLFCALVGLAFGTFPDKAPLAADDPLPLAVALDLGAEVRSIRAGGAPCWRVPKAYLEACNKAVLLDHAIDEEVQEALDGPDRPLRAWKKGELVEALDGVLERRALAGEPPRHLPDAFTFADAKTLGDRAVKKHGMP